MRLLVILLGIAIVWVMNDNITLGFLKHKKQKKPAVQQKLDEPKYIFQPYNDTPGTQELNLYDIEIKRLITGPGIVSPNMAGMAYSEVYFYPQNHQINGKLFYVNLGHLTTLSGEQAQKILKIKAPDVAPKELMSVGFNIMANDLFETLTVVDWSHNSRKILIKETTGERFRGIKSTTLWIYDFYAQKVQKIDTIKKAIAYYWKKRENLILNDYIWDIVPLGWDQNDQDRIIVNAYGYRPENSRQFLGAWSIDSEDKKTRLLSLDNEHWPIAKNGQILVEEKK